MESTEKFMRTIRVRNEQQLGTLGRLLVAVADAGGDVGEVRLIQETSRYTIRDISVYSRDEAHLDNILQAMESNQGSQILAVRDEVLELHQKGKIAVRSRVSVDNLYILRRVYTPGVAEVCLRIAKDPSLARQYTAISHLVAIVTDGTAILGLGNIGPVAGMPVI
jgi:malate dehydrogenase (oxaloacetate-decarboxylating)